MPKVHTTKIVESSATARNNLIRAFGRSSLTKSFELVTSKHQAGFGTKYACEMSMTIIGPAYSYLQSDEETDVAQLARWMTLHLSI